jgi:hypothetical protein
MNDILGIENFNLETVSLTNFFLGIIINLFLALFVRYTYIKNSVSVSNKLIIANIFPIFSLSLYLIVITIKSSLVLSLGLVGALSIIRFRTAVKETEQIVYFLILTATSIATAANSYLFSVIFVTIIHFYNIYTTRKNAGKIHSVNDQIVINASDIEENLINTVVADLNARNIQIEIISLKKTKLRSTIVLRVSDFDLDLYQTIEDLIVQSGAKDFEIQFFSSTE